MKKKTRLTNALATGLLLLAIVLAGLFVYVLLQ